MTLVFNVIQLFDYHPRQYNGSQIIHGISGKRHLISKTRTKFKLEEQTDEQEVLFDRGIQESKQSLQKQNLQARIIIIFDHEVSQKKVKKTNPGLSFASTIFKRSEKAKESMKNAAQLRDALSSH